MSASAKSASRSRRSTPACWKDVVGHERVVGGEAEAEGARPFQHGPRDASEPDGGEGHRAEGRHRRVRRDAPRPGSHASVDARKLAGEAQREGERVVGDLVEAIVRDVADGDAPRPRRIEIHVVHADPEPDDHFAPVQRTRSHRP